MMVYRYIVRLIQCYEHRSIYQRQLTPLVDRNVASCNQRFETKASVAYQYTRQNWIVESESDPRVDVAFVLVDRRLLSAHDERYNANTINTIVDDDCSCCHVATMSRNETTNKLRLLQYWVLVSVLRTCRGIKNPEFHCTPRYSTAMDFLRFLNH